MNVSSLETFDDIYCYVRSYRLAKWKVRSVDGKHLGFGFGKDAADAIARLEDADGRKHVGATAECIG